MSQFKLMSYSEKFGPNLHEKDSPGFEEYEKNSKLWEAALRTNLKFLNEGKTEEVRKLEKELEASKKKVEGLEKTIENLKIALSKKKTIPQD